VKARFQLWRSRAVVLTALCCLVSSVHAGLFDDDEARKNIKLLGEKLEAQAKETDAKLQKLDESIKNLGIIQLLNQIEQLNAEIARLRGQAEVLANQNEQLQKRQRDFYLDIDTRLRVLEGNTAPSSSVPAPTSFGTPPSVTPSAAASAAAGGADNKVQAGSAISGTNALNGAPVLVPINAASVAAAEAAQREKENKSYDVGTNAFRRGDFAAAIRAFNTFYADYPQSQLAPNALYWIGLCQFNLKDYREARTTQENLIKKYPDSSKAPDALLVVASVQAEMGDAGSARNSYEDIIAKYPTSDAAAKARTRLSGLRR